MLKMILGVLLSQITFTWTFNITDRILTLQILPTFIGFFLIIMGTSEMEKESIFLRRASTKVLNFALFASSLHMSAVKLYSASDLLYGYVAMAISLLSYWQLYIIARAFMDVDAGYYLRESSGMMVSLVIIACGVEIITMVIRLLLKNYALAYSVSMIIYALDFMYVFKMLAIYRKYRRI